MAGNVFFSVSMSLDGYIAPESPEELMGRQWMELQQWVFPQRFFRETGRRAVGRAPADAHAASSARRRREAEP